jgi:anti-anti-sigma factor
MNAQDDCRIVYACPGDLTSSTAKSVREAIEKAITESPNGQKPQALLDLDLTQARFVDSVGINLLVQMIRRMKETGGGVRIRISNANIKRVLSFMRVDQHADVILA